MKLTNRRTNPKNLGRLWLAYTELQGDFTCYNSYLLTLGTLHSQNSVYGSPIYIKELLLWQYQLRMWACFGTTSYWKGSWAVVNWKCPAFLQYDCLAKADNKYCTLPVWCPVLGVVYFFVRQAILGGNFIQFHLVLYLDPKGYIPFGRISVNGKVLWFKSWSRKGPTKIIHKNFANRERPMEAQNWRSGHYLRQQTWVRSPRLRSRSEAEALIKSRSWSRSFEFLKARSWSRSRSFDFFKARSRSWSRSPGASQLL